MCFSLVQMPCIIIEVLMQGSDHEATVTKDIDPQLGIRSESYSMRIRYA